MAPDTPVLRGVAGLGAVALDVRLEDTRAHVATLEAVAVVDISDGDRPQLVTQVPTPGPALDVAQRDDLLIVADWDEIRGLSVADPDLPQIVLALSAASRLTRRLHCWEQKRN